MLGSIARRLRLFLRSELDLQKDSLIAALRDDAAGGARRESRFKQLGWQSRIVGHLTHVSGVEFVFDNDTDDHILKNLDVVAVMVNDFGAKLNRLPDGRVEFQIGKVRVAPETPQEAGILLEVFRDEIYRLDSKAPMFVWDVGANVGIASLYFAAVLGWDVAAYELFPATAKAAADNIARSGLADRITLNAAGVAGKKETLWLDYNPVMRGSNGMYGNDMVSSGEASPKVEVQVLDADEVLSAVLERAGELRVLAKFDCEGAEHDIIERLEATQQLRSLAAIVMELHEVPGRDAHKVISALTRSGFLVHRAKGPTGHLSIVHATRLDS